LTYGVKYAVKLSDDSGPELSFRLEYYQQTLDNRIPGRGSYRDSIYIRVSRRSYFRLVSVTELPRDALAEPASHLQRGKLNIEGLATALLAVCLTAVAIPREILSSTTDRAAELKLSTLKQNAYTEYL
jgi:hypothetical protein